MCEGTKYGHASEPVRGKMLSHKERGKEKEKEKWSKTKAKGKVAKKRKGSKG